MPMAEQGQAEALDGTVPQEVTKCRYRLVTDPPCDVENRAVYQHEKTAHADIYVPLTVCPDPEGNGCTEDCETEQGRARHLWVEHGIKAKTELRQELDAQQVKALHGGEDRPDATPEAVLTGENGTAVRRSTRLYPPWPDEDDEVTPAGPAPVALNGHQPAELDLDAALVAVSAVIAELAELRAEVKVLRADAELCRALRKLFDSRGGE
jgi:hypothetical protein